MFGKSVIYLSIFKRIKLCNKALCEGKRYCYCMIRDLVYGYAILLCKITESCHTTCWGGGGWREI